MTIKKQWLIVLVSVAIFAVFINSIILSSLINRYFKDYVKENYESHLSQIEQYASNALKSDNYSVNQMAIELETHLVDPIERIKLYDKNGNLIVDISADTKNGYGMMNGMMNKMMKRRLNMYQNSKLEEVDHANIYDGNEFIGQINITRYTSIENSIDAVLFQRSLLRNSFFSIGFVILFALLIGYVVSRKMSRELIRTANMAQNIEIGNEAENFYSNIKEIRTIQQSLESLSYKLKLKQKSRKTLIDELIHQTRTPLTIMKTHLEGIEDGIIEMSPEEIKIYENQIENITAIINNMSSLIDAERPEAIIHVEEFELIQLMKQITNGLKVQFEKKSIDLISSEHQKIQLKTDKYKLSQAIYNILTNAYKFTGPNGKVKINYEVNTGMVRLTIEDNGPGIREEEQEKIFQAYYKSNRDISTTGEGIGLYIAKDNLTRIHGTITVESRIGQGSKFILTFPLQYKQQQI